MNEWRRGWPVVTGAALAAATGVNLLYYVFSIFIPSLIAETGWTPGEISRLQALVGVGSLAAPLAGWAIDTYGIRPVYASGMGLLALFFLFLMMAPVDPVLFAISVFLTGLIGILTTSIAYTRAVAGWFVESRGMALAVTSMGLTVAAVFLPPLFEWVIGDYGWRAGYGLLAALSAFIGLPAILFLIKEHPKEEGPAQAAADAPADRSHFKSATFWLIGTSIFAINMPGSGFLSQMVPMLKLEGLTMQRASFGISAFAAGTFAGRLVSGWLLDRAHPVGASAALTAIPALGCLALWAMQGDVWTVLAAVLIIGIQQGAEIDILAYFVSRTFGMARYGSIYGWVQVMGWAGTISGILLFGLAHDLTGNYAIFQLGGALSFLTAAAIMLFIRLPQHAPSR